MLPSLAGRPHIHGDNNKLVTGASPLNLAPEELCGTACLAGCFNACSLSHELERQPNDSLPTAYQKESFGSCMADSFSIQPHQGRSVSSQDTSSLPLPVSCVCSEIRLSAVNSICRHRSVLISALKLTLSQTLVVGKKPGVPF